MLLTSQDSKERVSEFQRMLYRKAKQDPVCRFYSLYDKVYRSDVLQRAYELVKRNKGKHFPYVEPSEKSMKSIKTKIKHYTHRTMGPVPIGVIVNHLNDLIRGWSHYFYYAHGHKKMNKIKYYMEESLRSHLRSRHKVRHKGASYHQFPKTYLYDYLELYKPPVTPSWKLVHA